MAIPPARSAALAALGRVFTHNADVQPVLDAVLREYKLESRDSGLATELVYGVLRRKIRLDYLIDSHLTKPSGLPPKLRTILCTAVFEMLFLDRVPDYATVDWAVAHTKKRLGNALGKLANAVLRNVGRLEDDAFLEPFYRKDDPAEHIFLSRYYSCPRWIVKLWQQSYSEEDLIAYLIAQSQSPAQGYRLNKLRSDYDGLSEAMADMQGLVFRKDCAFAFRSDAKPDLELLLDAGALTRQSAASQQALLELDPDKWAGPVWDCCSGRGGKTMLLHERGKAPLYASDPHEGRITNLRREADRQGHDSLRIFRARADEPAPLKFPPSTILIDAPCSGLGVMSRRPDTKLKRKPEDLDGLVDLQASILNRAARSVLPGSRIAYVTCTLNPAENEAQIRQFMEKHSRATLEREFQTSPTALLGEYFYSALIRMD